MMNLGYWGWPFMGAFFGLFAVVAVLFLIFWIWMIVDAAQRKFRNDVEKIVWILVIIFGHWVGALVYFLVIRSSNPNGLMKK